jgi:predicted peptidase
MITKTFLAETAAGKIPMALYSPTTEKTGVCVVAFHGKGEAGNGTLDSINKVEGNFSELLKRIDVYGFSVLAPQVSTNLTNGNLWWSDNHIEAIIDYAIVNHTKLGKVAVTGLSQGGGSVIEAITNPKTAPKIFVAIPICPTPQYDNDFSQVAKNKIATWFFHAVDDQTVKAASSQIMVAKIKSFNPDPPVTYTELTSGNHYIWGTSYNREAIYPYILSFAPTATQPIPPVDPLPVDEILSIHKITYYKSGKATLEKL